MPPNRGPSQSPEAPTPKFIPVRCAPKKALCPRFGTLRTQKRTYRRTVLTVAGGRTQPLAAHAFGLGPAVNVALQVGQLQLADREPLAEGGDQVLEMQIDPVDGPLFEGFPVRGQGAVAEVGKRQLPRFGWNYLGLGQRPAIGLDEGDDVEAGRQLVTRTGSSAGCDST
jgi:hypothetical protein